VLAQFSAGVLCYRYALTMPLGPGSVVTGTELPACPTINAP
jgi:hypothetical protein